MRTRRKGVPTKHRIMFYLPMCMVEILQSLPNQSKYIESLLLEVDMFKEAYEKSKTKAETEIEVNI